MITRFIRFPELKNLIGLSRSTIWRMEKKCLFPHRTKLSTNTIGWNEEDIAAWIRNRTSEKIEASSFAGVGKLRASTPQVGNLTTHEKK